MLIRYPLRRKLAGLMLSVSVMQPVNVAHARPQKHGKPPVKVTPAWQRTDSRLTRLPGSWRQERVVLSFDSTGLSGDMAEMAKAGKASVGQKEVSDPFCIRPKSVLRDSLMTRLQDAARFGPEWTVDRAFFGGDQVNFAAHMQSASQGSATMKIEGMLTRARSELTLTTDSSQPGGGTGRIHTVSRVLLTRLGDCTPAEVEVE